MTAPVIPPKPSTLIASGDHPPKPFYETKDLQYATCFVASGVRFHGIRKTEAHTLFCFEDDPRIPSILTQFINDELLINARDLFRIWRDLRSMTYAAPGGGR